MHYDKILDVAYSKYMPQIASEIRQLSEFLYERWKQEENYQPCVVEIGTKYGGTFYIWNQLQKELSVYSGGVEGTAISIDMNDGGQHGGISDIDMDARDEWFYTWYHGVHFIRHDSHHPRAKRVVEFILDHTGIGEIDFLFIDGDHSYEGVKADFEMYSPLVAKNGIIAFHDIVISTRHHDRNVYVGEFWRELTKVRNPKFLNQCMIGGNWYEIYEFVEPGNDWAGIGVLIKL